MSQGEVGATEGFLGRAEMWSDTGAAVLWEWGRMGWSDFGFHEGGCDEGVGCSGGRGRGWDDCRVGMDLEHGAEVGLHRWEAWVG